MTLRAPAKINLGLAIGKRRPDGYHDLETIFARINLYDEVTLRPLARGISLRARPSGVHHKGHQGHKTIVLRVRPSGLAGLPEDAENIAVKAARLFFAATGCRPSENLGQSTPRGDSPARKSGTVPKQGQSPFSRTGTVPGVEITLLKRIPIGAGLGGGSSDAAAVLQGMNRLFGKPLTAEQLNTLGLQLGSDVPFFLTRSACLAGGRGERLRPVRLPKLRLLLHIPSFPVATAWAYRQLDRLRTHRRDAEHAEKILGSSSAPSVPLRCTVRNAECGAELTEPRFSPKIAVARLQAGKLEAFGALLHNSFEPVVFNRFPELGRLKALMLDSGAEAALLSGSGSALYAILPESAARRAHVVRALRRNGIAFHRVETIA